jgi:hypothetical protein
LAQGPDEKNGLAGLMSGLARRTMAPAAATSVNLTLLAESTRRVGTAWPADGSTGLSGARKAARKIRFRIDLETFDAALHNQLILFGSAAD